MLTTQNNPWVKDFPILAVRAGVEVHELGTRCFRHPLPGHQIGVVFGHRDHDFVALMQEMQAITIGHQIQGFGGVLGEDDLIILGPKEPRQDRKSTRLNSSH